MQSLGPDGVCTPLDAVFLVAAYVAATLFLPGAVRAEDAAVQIDDFAFSPPSLTV